MVISVIANFVRALHSWLRNPQKLRPQLLEQTHAAEQLWQSLGAEGISHQNTGTLLSWISGLNNPHQTAFQTKIRVSGF